MKKRLNRVLKNWEKIYPKWKRKYWFSPVAVFWVSVKKRPRFRLTVIEKQVEEVPVEAIQVEEVSVEVKPVESDGGENRNDAEEVAADAKEFLNTILEKMGISAVIEKMIKADRITLHIHGDDLGVLIGKHGQTLDALQYIINLKANKGKEKSFFHYA